MSDLPTPLESEIRRRIVVAGPMPVGEYMALCLADPQYGYYMTRDPLGRHGDFITAPEVSQMFGELIGLWMAAVWTQMGSPENVRVIELGPGRGTLMHDALRAMQVMPAFRAAIALHLVEISPPLRAQQERKLQDAGVPVAWHAALDDVPAGPAIVIANEFFDALPINQAVKAATGWHERLIEIDASGRLAFTVAGDPIPQFDRLLPAAVRAAPEASIFEWRSDLVPMQLGRRLMHGGGAALAIDYGHVQSAAGETLQAVGQHAFADPLGAPGHIDLTAHVDFAALARGVEAMGPTAYGPFEQSQLLRRLGIETRAVTLKIKATRTGAAEIDSALARLIGEGRSGMGALFKVMAFAHPSVGVPPGFA